MKFYSLTQIIISHLALQKLSKHWLAPPSCPRLHWGKMSGQKLSKMAGSCQNNSTRTPWAIAVTGAVPGGRRISFPPIAGAVTQEVSMVAKPFLPQPTGDMGSCPSWWTLLSCLSLPSLWDAMAGAIHCGSTISPVSLAAPQRWHLTPCCAMAQCRGKGMKKPHQPLTFPQKNKTTITTTTTTTRTTKD